MKMEDIITRLIILRKRANLSGRKLSCILGKVDSYIPHLEKNKFKPSLQGLLDILDVYKVSPAIFFSDDFVHYFNNDNNIALLRTTITKALENIKDS